MSLFQPPVDVNVMYPQGAPQIQASPIPAGVPLGTDPRMNTLSPPPAPPFQQAAASEYPQAGRPSQFPQEGRPSTYPLTDNTPSYTGQPLVDKYIHSFIGGTA